MSEHKQQTKPENPQAPPKRVSNNGGELTGILMTGAIAVPAMLAYYSLLMPQFTAWLAIDSNKSVDPVYRLVFALRWLAPVGLTLIICIQAVAFCRLFTPSIDGRTPHPFTDLWRSILQNTIEQAFLLTLNVLALSQNLPSDKLAAIPMAIVLFVVARFIFAIGYIIYPTRRALGFILTFLPNVFMVGYNIRCLVRV